MNHTDTMYHPPPGLQVYSHHSWYMYMYIHVFIVYCTVELYQYMTHVIDYFELPLNFIQELASSILSDISSPSRGKIYLKTIHVYRYMTLYMYYVSLPLIYYVIFSCVCIHVHVHCVRTYRQSTEYYESHC